MSICCPKSIKACAMRITRLDDCSVPLDPLTPNSRIQTAGFMELNLSPDVEDGEDITTKNACGDICIRDKDCDRLKGFEVELKLCGIPLPVIEMLTGATLLDDGALPTPNIVGAVMKEAKALPCEDPRSLEFWSKNADKNLCGPGGVTGNQFIHWVLPRTINWEISGGLNFTIGALEVTLSGYAENNPQWFPSYPGPTFPSWSPAYPASPNYPIGAAPPILPTEITTPDPWSLADQAAIQAGGPLAWRCVTALPEPLAECAYVGSTAPGP